MTYLSRRLAFLGRQTPGGEPERGADMESCMSALVPFGWDAGSEEGWWWAGIGTAKSAELVWNFSAAAHQSKGCMWGQREWGQLVTLCSLAFSEPTCFALRGGGVKAVTMCVGRALHRRGSSLRVLGPRLRPSHHKITAEHRNHLHSPFSLAFTFRQILLYTLQSPFPQSPAIVL